MKVFTPPNRVNFGYDKINVFLAGSIEMGEATEWQKKAIDLLGAKIPDEQRNLYQILNPRRADWDPNWEQTYEHPQFYQQVKWELKCLKESNIIFFYFDPATKSPISLLELGAFHQRAVVVCPEGFWRKGNVDIFCEEFDIPQYTTLEAGIDRLIEETKNAW